MQVVYTHEDGTRQQTKPWCGLEKLETEQDSLLDKRRACQEQIKVSTLTCNNLMEP